MTARNDQEVPEWEEIRRDIRSLIAEWRELRVYRALGREFRDIERQVLEEVGK